MSGGETDLDDGTEIPSSNETDTEFEPAAEPDDEFFAVLTVDYLHELLEVYEPTDVNAVFVIRQGVGLKVRSRTEHCYWFEVELPTDVFEVFQVEDTDLPVAMDALERAVSETNSHRVSFHGKPDGSIVLNDGRSTYDLSANDTPLRELDEDEDPLRTDKLFDDMWVVANFTIDAVELKALIGADTDHKQAGITVDTVAETVEVFFFDLDNKTRTIGLELTGEDFIEPPSKHWPGEDPDVTSVPVCRDAMDQALPPMRGEVTIGASGAPTLAPTQLRYTRANGELPVYAGVTGLEGGADTLEAIIEDQ